MLLAATISCPEQMYLTSLLRAAGTSPFRLTDCLAHAALLGNQTARSSILASQANLVSRAAQACRPVEAGRRLQQHPDDRAAPESETAVAAGPVSAGRCDNLGVVAKPVSFTPGNCSRYNLGMCHSGEGLPRAPTLLCLALCCMNLT